MSGASMGWRGRLLAGLARPAGGGAGRPAAKPEPSPPPSPGPAKPAKPAKPAARKGGVVAVTVVGLAGDALERVLDLVERECAADGSRPVFVTDSHELEPFRRRKVLVDQVVDAEARLAAASDLPWRLYRRRQYALMGARWRPAAVVAFGRRPDEDCLKGLRGT